ncbi:MAG: DnaJ domain-containing protein [Blastocatellia bacterium]|nr:DnaJ domain-containing protein [Blastocatellia bacterium]
MFIIDLGAPSYYSTLGLSPIASFDEIRTARDQMIKELRDKQSKAATPEEKQKFIDRQTEINAIGETLARPEKRKEYDRANAHLGFFMVQVAAAPLFMEKADRMHVLHRMIKDFLAARGVELRPLSDMDRDDFSADETPIELLDNLLREEKP